MATINPNQDYDMIQTLTFEQASGYCKIRLHRGSFYTPHSGIVYARNGTSGSWNQWSISGDDLEFPVTSTTMQIAHNWNKNENHYMTCSFAGQSTNLKEIKISQKAAISGSIGTAFMYAYAYDCSSLIYLDAPDTSNATDVGPWFMHSYARGCSSLTHLDVPDTSNLTSADYNFMHDYARDCSSLTSLNLPSVGYFKNNDVDWSVPSSRLGILKGHVKNDQDFFEWKKLLASGRTLYINYVRDNSKLVHDDLPGDTVFDVVYDIEGMSAHSFAFVDVMRQGVLADGYGVYYKSNNSWEFLSDFGPQIQLFFLPGNNQLAHNWNKDENNNVTSLAITASVTEVSININTPIIGPIGDFFMNNCITSSTATHIHVPDTSGITSTGSSFMSNFASNCPSLVHISPPDTSAITKVQNAFLSGFVKDCTSLESVGVPDTSKITQTGFNFLASYASGCSSLLSLSAPVLSPLLTTPSYYFLNSYAKDCTSLTSLGVPNTSNIVDGGISFMNFYASGCTSLTELGVPNTSNITNVTAFFMNGYAKGCTNLTSLKAPNTSNITNIGTDSLKEYASGCSSLKKLEIPNIPSNVGMTPDQPLMDNYAKDCTSLNFLELNSPGFFKKTSYSWNDLQGVPWGVPSSRLGILKGVVMNGEDLQDWKDLTASGRTLYINYIRNINDVIVLLSAHLNRRKLL